MDSRSGVVLGIGNVLWADEGFGVRAAEALHDDWTFDDDLRIVDGGTQGLYLLPLVQSASHLLILDAVDYGMAPGTLRVARDEDVPRYLGARKMSLHQTGFQEVLMLARLTEAYPGRVTLVGCQPQEIEDYGGSLRPVVRAALAPALSTALQELASWGWPARRRTAPPAPEQTLRSPVLALAAYEAGRPSAEAACRVGDDRFMPRAAPPPGAA